MAKCNLYAMVMILSAVFSITARRLGGKGAYSRWSIPV